MHISKTKEDAVTSASLRENPYFLYSVLIGLLFLLFYPLMLELIKEWYRDPEFSHGFLIPIVSGYLVWIQRGMIAEIRVEWNSRSYEAGSPLRLIVGLLLFALGSFLQHVFVQGIALIVVLSGLVLFLYSRKMLRVLLFPIGYLVFMLPIPHAVNLFFANQLKFLIADSSGALLSLAHIPVLLEGNMIHLASISLEVVEACSGMQTIMSFLAIGSVFAYLGYRSNLLKTLVVILTIPMALAANVLRVTAIGGLSYYFNNQVAHIFHGYAWTLIVLLGVLGFMAIDSVIRRYLVVRPAADSWALRIR